MRTSVFDLFKIGIGPSSSHTVGPMRAALLFAEELKRRDRLAQTARVVTELYGSLALTGPGHGTDRAVLLGLSGERPAEIDPATMESKLTRIRETGKLELLGEREIAFTEATDLRFLRDEMFPPGSAEDVARHPNGMRCTAFSAGGHLLAQQVYFSVGGGFVLRDDELAEQDTGGARELNVPHVFRSAADLLATCEREGMTIAELMRANETALAGGEPQRVSDGLVRIWQAMQDCCDRGWQRGCAKRLRPARRPIRWRRWTG